MNGDAKVEHEDQAETRQDACAPLTLVGWALVVLVTTYPACMGAIQTTSN